MAPLLFHKDVFIPDFAKVPLHEGPLRYGNHAKNVTAEGGQHKSIPLPEMFVAKNATLIEVEVNPVTGEVEKQVWRQPLDNEWDMCFPMIAGGFVKTVWLNHRTDTHKTLNKAKFVGGYQWRNMRNKLKPKASA
jgi:hypothetical protein